VVQVGFASDGIEALKEYKNAAENGQKYDVVLMDLIMPEQDGYETTI
jgi:CheY-like chemotaxis protein